MTTEHDIKKVALIISKYLPKWNHIYAKSEQEKEAFVKAVNQLDYTQNEELLWNKFAHLINQFVPDNHILLKRNGQNIIPKKIPTSKVDIKMDLPLNYEKFEVSDKGDWFISTQKISNKNVGIVTIPFFAFSENETEGIRERFIKRFFELKKENNWQDIIFDFRGNTGGDAQVLKEIAERLAGSSLKYADRVEAIIPQETDPYHHIFQNKIQESEMYSFITGDQHERAKGNIYILQDGWNASASEGAIFMLKQLKNSYSIGEQTSGTYQSGATVSLQVAPNIELVIGTKYMERLDQKGNIIEEKKGFTPDFQVHSQQAMKKAFSLIRTKNLTLIRAFSILAKMRDYLSKNKNLKKIQKQNNQR